MTTKSSTSVNAGGSGGNRLALSLIRLPRRILAAASFRPIYPRERIATSQLHEIRMNIDAFNHNMSN
jgi:hypothetical protein